MYVLSALITLNHGNADFTYIILNGLYGIACLYYTKSIALNYVKTNQLQIILISNVAIEIVNYGLLFQCMLLFIIRLCQNLDCYTNGYTCL